MGCHGNLGLKQSGYSWGEQVTGAVNRADKCCVMVELAKLPSNLTDKHINIAIIRVPFSISNLVHQLISRHDFAGIFDESKQEMKFTCREWLQLAIGSREFALVKIQRPSFEFSLEAFFFLLFLRLKRARVDS